MDFNGWKNLNGSESKRNKIWLDKDSKFYNNSSKSWLQNNNLEIYATHDERKSVVAVRFVEP